MELQRIEGDFTVCKVNDLSQIDFSGELVFLAKTQEEISLVCPSVDTPAHTIAAEPGWRGFKVAGILDFSMIGVIANIGGVLAEAGISIFVVSTYNTDYVFTKAQSFDKAVQALVDGGYVIT